MGALIPSSLMGDMIIWYSRSVSYAESSGSNPDPPTKQQKKVDKYEN